MSQEYSDTRVKVLGDLAFLHLYESAERLRDRGIDPLAPYRRVRESSVLKLRGGAWSLARFIRAALRDVTRIPLTLPIDLSQTAVTIRRQPSGSACRLAITTADQRQIVIPASTIRLQIKNPRAPAGQWLMQLEVYTENPKAIKALEILLAHDPAEAPAIGVLPVTDEDSFSYLDVSLQKTNTPQQPLSSLIMEFSSEVVGELQAAYLDIGNRTPASLLPTNPARKRHMPQDQTICLNIASKDETQEDSVSVYFPSECAVTFREALPRAADGEVLATIDSGNCLITSLERQDRKRFRFEFNFADFLPFFYLARVTINDVGRFALPTPATPQQIRTVRRWKSLHDKNAHPLGHVSTYSEEPLTEDVVTAWWEVTRRTGPVRLSAVFGYEADNLESSYEHGSYPLEFHPSEEKASGRRHLAFVDLNFGFRKSIAAADPTKDLSQKFVTENELCDALRSSHSDWGAALAEYIDADNVDRGWLFVDLGRCLPVTLNGDREKNPGWDTHDLWDYLRRAQISREGSQTWAFRHRTIVIVSAQLLRANGARIGHRLSWERAAEDSLDALRSHPLLRPLLDFSHLIIRFGCVGALYVRASDSSDEVARPQQSHLLYDVLAKDGFFRDPEVEGQVLGFNSVFIASIMRSVVDSESSQKPSRNLNSEQMSAAIRRGIRWGIQSTQRLFDRGYDAFKAIGSSGWLDYNAPEEVFEVLDDVHDDASNRSEAGDRAVAITDVSVGKALQWSIVNSYSEGDLARAAHHYVKYRLPGSLRRFRWLAEAKSPIVIELEDGVFAPVTRFNQFATIAREEAEAYRSIHSILRRYILFPESDSKPVSIAVYGPPGSGKSMGVRAVSESVKPGAVKMFEFNLAQFSSPDDLVIPLLKAREVEKGQVPLIFFDEFDSALEGVPLGWLRYLLQPMQDGTFKHGEEVRTVGRAIFVFAGGTAESFQSFSKIDASETDQQTFRLAKGPDFTSRLSGYIDTCGINRRKGEPDPGFVLRRALLLRSLLEQRGLTGSSHQAVIDDALISAFLNVGSYRYGARSMRIVLNMCVGEQGVIRMPSPGQLEMHLGKSDAEAFTRTLI